MLHSRLKIELKTKMKKRTKKAQEQELLAKLHDDANTEKSKTEVAQNMQAEAKTEAKAVKVREVKDFIKTKNSTEIEKAQRVIEKQRRSYIVYNKDSTNAEVYYSTTYFNKETQKEEYLSAQIARKLVQQFVANLKQFDKFTAQTIMHEIQSKGSAYGDLVRNALYEISQFCTAQEVETNIDAIVAKAQENKKNCIYFNVLSDAHRARYMFIKV